MTYIAAVAFTLPGEWHPSRVFRVEVEENGAARIHEACVPGWRNLPLSPSPEQAMIAALAACVNGETP